MPPGAWVVSPGKVKLLKVYSSTVGQRLGDVVGVRRRAFERAYRAGAWTSTGESISGDGSSLDATERLRRVLPDALRTLGVRTLLDVPCGDWHWMSRIELPVDHYIGGDLVPALVEANQRRYGDERHEFRVIDLCRDELPRADLLLCRDAVVHFAYADICAQSTTSSAPRSPSSRARPIAPSATTAIS